MKKKILLGMMAFATWFATSCTNELDPVNGGDTSTVSFKVETPKIESRTYSDGTTATVLQYAVYNEAGEELTDLTVTDGEIHSSTTVNLTLTTGNTYSVIFWAAAPNAPYAVDFANKTMTVDYNAPVCNDETRDAFYKYHTFTVTGAQTETIELKRPFAQLNIGTADYAASTSAGYTPNQSAVTVKNVYSTLNLATGEVDGADKVVYAYADIKKDEIFPVQGYEYLAMNYLLVDAEKELVDIEFTYTDGSNAKTRTVGSVPVQRNYRTNIYGNILTSEVDINVEIKPEYEMPNYEEVVWDGKAIKEPKYDETTNTYEISHASELAWLAAAVNGTLPENRSAIEPESFAGKTFVLTEDVDLCNNEWTPIGTSSNIFKGIFDGNGKTVKNLVVNGYNGNVGLFGVTHDGEIKDLTVENAKVSGRLNVGVVSGQPYTSKYTNITVKGHVEVNGMAYVGGVGGKNAYADWTNIKVEVDETSYIKANSVENGTAYRTYVGGVVGFNGEGNHKFSNIISNINVEGSTCDVGGLFGIAHYGNQFENCVCTGNVKIYAAEETDEAKEIGGIAGVWHNSTGYSVTMTNCSFKGDLSTNIETEFYYGGLVGKPYGDGEGKLVIDGVEFTKNDGVNFAFINDVLKAGETFVMPFDLTGKATASNAYGATGIVQNNGGTLDGADHTLKVTGASGTWGTAISTTGGTIKNVTVAQGFRGIFVNHNSEYSEKVILKNVTINGPTYTISCDQGMNQGLEAYNSTFNGWTSYAATIGNVKFENCSFGQGAGYKFCRPYAPTIFIGCNFCEGYTIDARAEIVLVNCTLNGVPVTEENLATLVTGNTQNAGFAPVVENVEALKKALDEGASYVKVAAGEYTFPSSLLQNGVTIECAEGTVFTGKSSLNINGSTVIGATFSNNKDKVVGGTIYGTFKNCRFEGSNNALRDCYVNENKPVVFEDCVFSGSVYGVHFDGNSNGEITFRNCTLSGFNAFAAAIKMVTFENCTFVGNGKSGYNGANLWGSTKMINCEFTFDGSTTNEWIDCIGADKTYEFTNCTINGVAYTPENYANYLTNISSRNEITVKIDGVDCNM